MSKPRVIKELSTPTGSTIACQPLGGCEYPSQRADFGKKGIVYPHQTVLTKNSNIHQTPVWISTTSRPGVSGFNAMSPRGRRTLSPPQPPPLPPPPPSPQLVPLKARLARSKSTATRPVTTRPDYCQRLRKASDGGAPTRLTNSSSVRTRSTSELRSRIEAKDEPSEIHTVSVESSEEKPSVSTVNPSAFLPIAHPTERSPVYVCLANVAFLSLSLLVTSIFSIVFLPFCLIACLVRRTGIWIANVFQYTTCCQCGGFLISDNTNPIIESIMSRLSVSMNSNQRCHCFTDKQLENRYSNSLKALSSAELRWLPALEYKYELDWNGTNYATLYCSGHSPIVIICLRFGAPGLKLVRLRELISNRLLSRPFDCSSVASSPRGSCLTDKGCSDTSRRRCESSYIPPSDARSRLTQCLTYLSTGYAWRECMAFQLEEHVVRLSSIQTKSEINPSRSYGSKWEDKHSANPKMVNLEVLLNELSSLPLRLDRPLWKAHLMEHFYENDCDETTEPSDIESDADSDESKTCKTSHSSRKPMNNNGEKLNKTKKCLINNYNQTYATTNNNSKRNLNSFVCRRSGSSGVGSLLIFQFHAALSDDGKALVHMVTNCLADLPSRTQTPQHSPNKQTPIHTASSIDDQLNETTINQSTSGAITATLSSPSSSSCDNRRKWRGQNVIGGNYSDTNENNTNTSNNNNNIQNDASLSNKNASKWSTTIKSSRNSTSPYNSTSFYHSCDLSKTTLTNEQQSQLNNSNISINNKYQLNTFTKFNSNQIQSKPNQNERLSISASLNSSITTTTMTSKSTANSLLDDEDSEESEAAQWWYTFWASSLATIATVCDILRVLITGPTIIFHKYFITNADMGLITRHQNVKQSKLINNKNNQSNNNNRNEDIKTVHKCALLSLAKLSRLRQITKASYSELILSLLAGALRGYHQTMGFKHPPDLLAFLSTEVPVLPNCHLNTPSVSVSNCNNNEDPPCTTLSRVLNITQRVRTSSNLDFLNISPCRQQQQRIHHDNNTVETGLLGNTNRMVALGSPNTTSITATRNLCPGRNVLTEFCLPINTEGMLPRLWETKQRLTEVNTSVDSLCLAWARTALYTLMPHSVAKWIETTYGGLAKGSVTITGVEVISPFTTSTTATNTTTSNLSKITDSNYSYQMPKSRRLAYMSLLANKSSDARILRQRLRRRLPRRTTTATSSVYPPRLGTSFRALARHLVNANAGIMYIAGCPIIRIDTWMPSPVNIPSEFIANNQSPELNNGINKSASNETIVHICRDLCVTFTTYAGQLSLTFSASSKQSIHPNLDLIISGIKSQLNKMCQLLSGRHVPSMTSRWLRHSSNVESSVSALSAISMSPSLNPSLVLHNEISSINEKANLTTTTTSSSIFKMSTDNSTTSLTDELNSPKEDMSSCKQLTSECMSYNPSVCQFTQSNGKINKAQSLSYSTDGSKPIPPYQAGQPIEQLQEQLRWVQRQLEESSNVKNMVGSPTTNNLRLAKLRSEFCILLRQLKQRCSQGELGIDSSLSDLNNEFQDMSCESKLNCASISRSGNSSLQKFAQTTPGYPCLSGQFNVNPFKLEQNPTVKRSMTTGDFDEDPDFYITGQPEVDDFEDIDSSESEFALRDASNVISDNLFTATHNSNVNESMMDYNNINDPYKQNTVNGNEGELNKKRKRNRKNTFISGRRRPSKIAAEVINVNFMPSRRGSLMAHSAVQGHNKSKSLLTQFMNTVTKGSTSKLPRE
ncbi:Set1/Ash2 histone methyltransferase complex subunit ASH2 [Schistosoma haematobium]|uniref:Set1/Ash2 histone methyltransferase complex subunit ASH2 n=2 Tax=Schistosoma haematobium TaxID=6185 RepID=A0A922LR59_SCHHA|nr:Set1/Ash2 histone methyltransferase complex subunit ASH2 [Schistosoma haematobium]KAH9591735.1 Set1/Ash2 histone methyltransferase complex subunit ASH2 [Schistosoma haematobium]CAH8672739.1 unnamed protein product [Schistosoma haematobium]